MRGCERTRWHEEQSRIAHKHIDVHPRFIGHLFELFVKSPSNAPAGDPKFSYDYYPAHGVGAPLMKTHFPGNLDTPRRLACALDTLRKVYRLIPLVDVPVKVLASEPEQDHPWDNYIRETLGMDEAFVELHRMFLQFHFMNIQVRRYPDPEDAGGDHYKKFDSEPHVPSQYIFMVIKDHCLDRKGEDIVPIGGWISELEGEGIVAEVTPAPGDVVLEELLKLLTEEEKGGNTIIDTLPAFGIPPVYENFMRSQYSATTTQAIAQRNGIDTEIHTSQEDQIKLLVKKAEQVADA